MTWSKRVSQGDDFALLLHRRLDPMGARRWFRLRRPFSKWWSDICYFSTFVCVWPPVDFNTDPWKWYFCPSMLFSLCLSHPRVPDLQSSPTGAGNFTCFGEPGVGQRCSAPCVEGPDAAARHPVHSKETIFDLPSEIWYFSILGLPFAWNMWKFVATPIPDAPSLDSGSVKTAWHGWRQHDVICGWFGAIMGYLMVLGKVMPRTWRWERSEKERESKSYI